MRFRQYFEASEANEGVKTLQAQIPLDPEVYILKQLFERYGQDLRVVGGTVRDYLMQIYRGGSGENYNRKDVDLVTPASPEEIQEILQSPDAEEQNIHALPTGAAFGIWTAVFPLRPDDINRYGRQAEAPTYEIASYRKDVGGGGRKPDAVERVTEAKHDAQRRDLAYNALYYDIPDDQNSVGLIYDYNNGQGIEDCKTGLPHFVGNPMERCKEDNLRVMRYIRFFSRGNAGGPEVIERDDPAAAAALHHFAPMPAVSEERIIAEFMSGLSKALDPVNFLRTLHHFGIMDRMFRNLKVNPRFQNLRVLGAGDMARNPRLVLAYLLKDNDPSVLEQTLTALKFNSAKGINKLTEGIVFLVRLASLSDDTVYDLAASRNRLRPDVRASKPEEREKFIGSHNAEMQAWATLLRMDQNKMADFARYERTIRGNDPRFTGLSGEKLGQAIKAAEKEAFVGMSKEKKR